MTDFEASNRVLDLAKKIISGDRHNAYGDAEDEFARIAVGWSALVGAPVTARQVALMMCWLKICREDFQHKEDNLVDLIGYAALANRMTDEGK